MWYDALLIWAHHYDKAVLIWNHLSGSGRCRLRWWRRTHGHSDTDGNVVAFTGLNAHAHSDIGCNTDGHTYSDIHAPAQRGVLFC